MSVQTLLGATAVSCVVVACGTALAQQNNAGPLGSRVVERSADGVWSVLDTMPPAVIAQPAYIRPDVFTPATVDMASVAAALAPAPSEADWLNGAAPVAIDLPMPEGGFDTFLVYQTPMLAPGLQAKYPGMRTYAGESTSDATASVRITVTHLGFDAMVMRAGPDVFVDRYSIGNDSFYTSYMKPDLTRDQEFVCSFQTDRMMEIGQRNDTGSSSNRGVTSTLHTFRAAISATGEYTQFFGGTRADGQAAIVTAMNRVSGIYERDLAARLQLVANNDQVVFTNPATDPYGSISLSVIDNVIDSTIGVSNYDVGHLVDTGGGGFAFLGVVCTSSKGGGYTGLTPPSGDPFYVDYLAHELGHQFGGAHTFNGDSGSCAGGNRSGSSAYEPGSGTTIMAYAGICGNDNVQSNSDDYFHWRSLQQMSSHINSRGCDVETTPGNNLPTADAGFGGIAPLNTPFKLVGSGSDPDSGNILTYCWEQADLGAQRDVNASDNGSSPIFRSFDPTTSPVRYFPRPSDWRDGTLQRGEKLPTVARTLDFRLTVRDNAGPAGAYDFDDTSVQVIAGVGPFRVTAPASPVTITNGQLTVTWDVAGTDSSPLFESSVNILFSDDGANTFAYTLASGTPNDGSETVTLPPVITSQGYVIVEAANGIFWDMNKAPINVDIPPDPIEFTFPNGLPTSLTEGQPTTLTVNIDPGTQGPLNPATAFLFYGYDVVGQPFLPVSLVNVGGDTWEAELPGGACGETASFYFSITNDSFETFTSPSNPATPYTAPVSDCGTDCAADTNNDGALTPADFNAWIVAFNAQAPECDQNNDGLCNPSDFNAWIANYNAGCP